MDKELKDLLDALAASDAKMSAMMAEHTAQIAAAGQANADLIAKLNAEIEQGTRMQARVLELEQRAASLIAQAAGNTVPSISATAIDSPEFKAVMAGQAASGRITMAGSWWAAGTSGASTINSGTTGAGAAGDLIQPMRVPGIIGPAERTLTIRDLLMPGNTSSNAVEYIRETGFTNAADFVTEGQLKPQSDLTFSIETAAVRTIAHWVKATRQILSDVPMLRSYIEGRLRFGLRHKEEDALLNGTGTGQQIEGIKTVADAYDTGRNVTGDTKIDTISHALTQVRVAEYSATGIILHPNDWEEIQLTKTDDGAYVWANPARYNTPTLWGRPVVETTAQTEGEFTVGAFRLASQIFDREDISVEIATQHASDFTSNLVRILAEERLTVAHYRPEALIDGAFPA